MIPSSVASREDDHIPSTHFTAESIPCQHYSLNDARRGKAFLKPEQ
jgi:hypothetical protein